MPLSKLYSSEIKNLAVAWCFYSGKIEGNTYTYVETEALLKDGITSPKRYEDAKMLKNLYNTFISELEYISAGNYEDIDIKTLFRVHQSLIRDLISDNEAENLRERGVAITGTNYKPPKNKTDILVALNEILHQQNFLENPLEKAVFLHCNLARIQPFIDGNKRTARVVESICLMNHDIVPVFSTNEADILEYRKAIIQFYENEDYNQYSDYFLRKKKEFLNEFQH